MDQISQAIKEISEVDFPDGLHGKIMRRLLFLRFRTPFLVISGLLVLNLVVSGWRLWEKMTEMETVLILRTSWDVVELNIASLVDFVRETWSVLPVGALVILFINILVIAYVVRLPKLLEKYKQPILTSL